MKKKILLLSLIFLSIDIVSKLLIDEYFNLMETKIIIANFFALTKVYNNGASWNILAGYRYLIIIFTIIIFIALIFYQKKFKLNKRNILAFSLVYSGIIGNLIDRIFNGYVIDFTIFGYNYPVFNFADIWIVVGIFLIIIAILKKEDENEVNSK